MASTCNPQSSPIEIFNSNSLPHTCADNNTLQHVLSIFFIILGAIAVLMVVIGGVRYVLASKPEDSAKARGMIIYALIGLVLSALATAIVTLVLGRLK